MENNEQVKSGIVALIGPPNVGKSTLLNALLGQKISIVSPKPQTTRNRIAGIINGDDYQLVLLDTPGIHQARSPLNLEMVRIAMESLAEVDAIVFMVDVTMPMPAPELAPSQCLAGTQRPVVLLMNKVDLLPREKLLPLMAAYQELYPFHAILPISALTGDGTELLLKELCALLPSGPRLYPEDIPTDVTERFIAAEIIREKVFLQTGQEVPYATAVTIDSFKENPARQLTTIHATIHVEKESQKGIIIGKRGSRLQQIGQAARKDLEELLDQQVLLKLWVKVRKDWTRNPAFLRELGF
ncbi:MAG: GTPase Era [Thermodesulfobacteriota bacterium]